MKKLIYSFGLILFSSGLFAQDMVDALRYSDFKLSGTARSAAMGNAFGSLGGDFTSLSINPAGAAVYRSGEFTLTPSLGKVSIDGTYLGTTANDSKFNFGINNVGYVATIPTGKSSESGLVSLSFGVGYNKLADFSSHSIVIGENSNSSLLDYFTRYIAQNNLQLNDFSDYYEGLAYDTYLINYDANAGEFYNDITDANFGQTQRKTFEKSGSINEYVLSFAANFNHKVYVGATLGIQDLYYKEKSSLFEYDAKRNIPYFDDFTYNSYLRTTGTGYNFKLGVIYKPTNELRLGLSVHTPTFFSLQDTYDNSMSSSITYDDGVTEHYDSTPQRMGEFNYKLETPFKTVLSGAYVIGKAGLISVDYEIVDYSSIKLRDGDYNEDFYTQNQEIENSYKTVGNLHIGGEYRVNSNVSLRAGYENYPSVYSSLNNGAPTDSKYWTASGGIGFKQGNFFLDMTYKYANGTSYSGLYPGANYSNYNSGVYSGYKLAKFETNRNNFLVTLGFKF